MFIDATNRPPLSALTWWGELCLRGIVAELKQIFLRFHVRISRRFFWEILKRWMKRGWRGECLFSFDKSRGNFFFFLEFFRFFFDFIYEYLENIFREEFFSWNYFYVFDEPFKKQYTFERVFEWDWNTKFIIVFFDFMCVYIYKNFFVIYIYYKEVFYSEENDGLKKNWMYMMHEKRFVFFLFWGVFKVIPRMVRVWGLLMGNSEFRGELAVLLIKDKN